MKSRTIANILVALAFSGSAQCAYSEGSGWVAYENLERWQIALRRGDVAQVSDLYTENAVVLHSDEHLTGNAGELESFIGDLMGKGFENAQFVLVDVHGDGNVVVATAHWSLHPRTGRAPVDGTLINVFEKQLDGNWKTRLQSWN